MTNQPIMLYQILYLYETYGQTFKISNGNTFFDGGIDPKVYDENKHIKLLNKS